MFALTRGDGLSPWGMNDNVSKSFAELVALVRQGDAAALEKMLDDYGEAIRREIKFTLLDQRLRRFVDDSDIYQSVVMRFFSGLREGHFQIESSEELLRLLKGIAHTRIAELVRYWHAQRRDLSRSDSLSAPPTDMADADGIQPLDAMELAEVIATMEKSLSPEDRQILRWRDDGLHWLEIAGRLGSPSSESARKQHERALAKIARHLARED